MKYVIFTLILIIPMSSKIIFDFNKNSDISGWNIIDDVVMGGKSSSSFKLSPDGFGVFAGDVSLENNGGFSSVRYRFQKIKIKGYQKIIVKLKGDGKKYQLRIKDNSGNYYSYITSFSTSGRWQDVEILLADMYPSFRGRKLEQPNFSKEYMEEMSFLIGNKKNEKFELLIDKIELF